ncbi:MAG: PKD domain-containing protein [Saprospiraceae bacterium]|nr:PKD domain-containing protein [Saprospiraceae bacterium]
MKEINFLVALIIYSICLQAQDKYDQIWLFGHRPNKPIDYLGGSIMSFLHNEPELNYFVINCDLVENASICDSAGKLVAYTNGCAIYNSNHKIVPNGDTLNPGETYNNYCNGSNGFYPTRSLALALPGFSPDTFYFFHVGDDEDGNPGIVYMTTLLHSEMNGTRIITKNNIIGKTKVVSAIQAVRHGNGRDWWIILHQTLSNYFFKYLLTPTGITGPILQQIGYKWTFSYWTSQAAFSPNGKWYSIMSESNGVHLFNFDRCTGLFSNYQELVRPVNDTRFYPRGICFSPNSNYLYLSADFTLYQYELGPSNVSNSYTVIDTNDFFKLPYTFNSSFYQLMLGPDNKIYGNTSSQTNFLHVIHNPDNKGDACNFVQHDILLPSSYWQSMPNFPHYRMYELEDSPCDTLGINKLPIANWRYEIDTLNRLNFNFTDLSYPNITSWSWTFGDSLSFNNESQEQNPKHEFSRNGKFNVCLTVTNKHGSHKLCKEITIGTVDANNEYIGISIFNSLQVTPNPIHEYLNIKITNYIPNKLKVYIYNELGVKVFSQHLKTGNNIVNTSFLISGLYLFKFVEEEKYIKTCKIIKQ